MSVTKIVWKLASLFFCEHGLGSLVRRPQNDRSRTLPVENHRYSPRHQSSTKAVLRKLAIDSVSFRGHSVCAVASAKLLFRR